MRQSKRVNFEDLVKKAEDPRCGHADISIWGGRCAQNCLKEFISQWDLARMPYRIWEYASEICFVEQNTPLQNETLLERARLFGPGGDLELRRAGVVFAWRFVGPAGVSPPAGDYTAKDYWESHPEVTFHQVEEEALLWGERNAGSAIWADNRVGAARLNYPAEGQRVKINYKVLSRAGRAEFVWFTDLSEYTEGKNG